MALIILQPLSHNRKNTLKMKIHQLKVSKKIGLVLILASIFGFNSFGQKRYFYNAEDKKCKANEATYYRDVVKSGSKYKIKEYYAANDQLKSSGSYSGDRGTNEEREGNFEFYHKNGTKKAEIRFKNGKEEGEYIENHDNGKIAAKGQFAGGNRNGQWETYYDNGQIKSKGRYFIGVFDSDWIWYYEDGTLKQQTRYKQGKKDGFYQTFYKNGKKDEDANYDGDSLVGNYLSYWESGVLSAEGKYFKNKRDSVWVWYHANGKMSCKANFTRGDFENATFYDEEEVELDKKIRNVSNLVSLPKFEGGVDAIWELINTSLRENVDMKAAKKAKYQCTVMMLITIDNKGNISESIMIIPNEKELFSDPFNAISAIQKGMLNTNKYTPKKAYNRNIEHTISLYATYDALNKILSLEPFGLD